MSFYKNCSQCGVQCDAEAVLCVSCGSFFKDKNAKEAQARKENTNENYSKAIFKQRIKLAIKVLIVVFIFGYGIYHYINPSYINTTLSLEKGIVSDWVLKKDFYHALSASPYWNDAKSKFEDERFTCDLKLETSIGAIRLDVKLNLDSMPLYHNTVEQRLPKDFKLPRKQEIEHALYDFLIKEELIVAANDIGKQLELIRLFKFSNEKMLNVKFLKGFIEFQNIAAAFYAPDWGRKYIWEPLLKARERSHTKYVSILIEAGMNEKDDIELIKFARKHRESKLIDQRLKANNSDKFIKNTSLSAPGFLVSYFSENSGIEKLIDFHYSREELQKNQDEINALSGENKKKYIEAFNSLNLFKKQLIAPHFSKAETSKLKVLYDRIKPDGNSFINKWLIDDLFRIANKSRNEQKKSQILKDSFAKIDTLKDNELKRDLVMNYTKDYSAENPFILEYINSTLSAAKKPTFSKRNITLIDGPDIRGIGIVHNNYILTKESNFKTAIKPVLTVYDKDGNSKTFKDYKVVRKFKMSQLVVVDYLGNYRGSAHSINFKINEGLAWRISRSSEVNNNELITSAEFIKFNKNKYGGKYTLAGLDKKSENNKLINTQSIIFNPEGDFSAISTNSGISIEYKNHSDKLISRDKPLNKTSTLSEAREAEVLAQNNFFEISEFYRKEYYKTENIKVLKKLIEYYRTNDKKELVRIYEYLVPDF